MKKLLCLLGGAMLLTSVHAQPIKGLTIGDTVPEMVLNSLLDKTTAFPAEVNFEDRLLILDFMNTGCSGCIAALPRIDSLAKTFKKFFTAFICTPENDKRVNNFKAHNPVGKRISLPFVTKDTILEHYFPHVNISHIVWIYNKKVAAITHKDYITEKNIKTVLSGASINWPVKRDVMNYDYNSPLIVANSIEIPEFSVPKSISYTAFLSHMDNISPRYTLRYDSISNSTRITAINYSIYQLCLKAFNLPLRFELSRVATDMDIKDLVYTTQSVIPQTDWAIKNTFCYEALMSGSQAAEVIEKKLKKDILSQFGLNVFIKDSIIPCWKLVFDSTQQRIPFDKFDNYAAALKSNETDVFTFVYKMNQTLFHAPVINENNYGSECYFKPQWGNLNDINAANKQLAPYGYSFVEVKKKLSVLNIQKINAIYNRINPD